MDNRNPLISVIVPVYNVEQYLPKCVESIINQTYKNLEIILVNDGSTDNSGKICDDYAFKDSRIKVIHKKNGGLSDARNAGMEIAKGDYIGFVDSDDYIALDMYEVLYNFAEKNDLDVAMCQAVDVHEGKDIPKSKVFKPIVTDNKNEIIYQLFVNPLGGACISVCNKIFKKHVVKNIRFLLKKSSEDAFFVLTWINNTIRFGRTSECMYYYLQRQGSITHLPKYNDSILDVIEAYERNYDEVKKNYPLSESYAGYRLYWAYNVALSRIFQCDDWKHNHFTIRKLQNDLRVLVCNMGFNRYINAKLVLKILMFLVNPKLVSLLIEIKKKAS